MAENEVLSGERKKSNNRPGARQMDLDLARSIGILLVVLAHAGLLLKPVAPWIYEFYMPLFLVLTGRLYHGFDFSSWQMVKKRLSSVLYSYFLACVALFLIWWVLFPLRQGNWEQVPRAVFSIVYGRFTDAANPWLVDTCWSGQLWYLSLLFSSTALYVGLRRIDNKTWLRRLLLAVGLLIAAQLLRATPVLLPWCLDTAPVGALLLLVSGWVQELPAKTIWWRVPAELVLFVVLHDTYDLHMRYYGRQAGALGVLAFFLAGFCGSDLLLLLCRSVCRLAPKMPRLWAVLLWPGKNSLGILCYHIFSIYCLKTILSRLPIAALAQTVALALGVCAVLPMCVLIDRALRRGVQKIRAVGKTECTAVDGK